jgi:hypothetical protein
MHPQANRTKKDLLAGEPTATVTCPNCSHHFKLTRQTLALTAYHQPTKPPGATSPHRLGTVLNGTKEYAFSLATQSFSKL